MILAIQEAYYLHARNPSDAQTLLALASEIGLDAARFARDLDAAATHAELARQIDMTRRLGVQGFPSLVLKRDGQQRLLRIEYSDSSVILDQLALADAGAPA